MSVLVVFGIIVLGIASFATIWLAGIAHGRIVERRRLAALVKSPTSDADWTLRGWVQQLDLLRVAVVQAGLREPFDAEAVRAALMIYRRAWERSPFGPGRADAMDWAAVMRQTIDDVRVALASDPRDDDALRRAVLAHMEAIDGAETSHIEAMEPYHGVSKDGSDATPASSGAAPQPLPPDPLDEAERRYHGKLAVMRRAIASVAIREPHDPDAVRAAVTLYKKAAADSPFRVDPVRDRIQAIITAALLVPFNAGAVEEAADAYRAAMAPDGAAEPPSPAPNESA